MKFSKNGKFLASAGQDAAVRVWEVCLNRGEPRESESEQSFSEAGARYLVWWLRCDGMRSLPHVLTYIVLTKGTAGCKMQVVLSD